TINAESVNIKQPERTARQMYEHQSHARKRTHNDGMDNCRFFALSGDPLRASGDSA
ncbi:hypothetical protein U1Q18_013813, partial [Sarracenia purpurea var. burkii]